MMLVRPLMTNLKVTARADCAVSVCRTPPSIYKNSCPLIVSRVVVGQVPDLPSCLPLTDNTRMLASILINKLYDDLRCDPERDHFRKICEEHIT